MVSGRSGSSSTGAEPRHARPRPEPKRLLLVGLWGAATTVIAYALSFGSIPIFVLNMFLIGALMRFGAYFLMKRRGQSPQRWWWL